MRRADLLITASREATESTNYSPDTGIQDSEFIEYLNNAQDRVYGNLLSVYPNDYEVEKVLTATAGTREYSIPIDCYLGTKIKYVEYSPTGVDTDYYELTKGYLLEKDNSQSGNPGSYIRKAKKLLINPAPNTNGLIRLTYFQKLPLLDKRRGSVLAVTLDTGTKTITALTLDISTLTVNDITDIQNDGYLSIVDKDGTLKMQGIPILSINTSTGVVTLDGAFTYSTGETISVGNWAVRGKYSTTHSQLDDVCERYLLAHCNWKILKRDSSNDSVESNVELTQMLSEIVGIYKDPDEGIDYVPILDSDYLSFE